jgi:hypothetical protein
MNRSGGARRKIRELVNRLAGEDRSAAFAIHDHPHTEADDTGICRRSTAIAIRFRDDFLFLSLDSLRRARLDATREAGRLSLDEVRTSWNLRSCRALTKHG